MTPPLFSHGSLRLVLLSLLAERPRHGYELIQALSDRYDGAYEPSAGTIYPRLAKLEEEGLVTKRVDGRKTVYEITDAGRAEVASRADELADIDRGAWGSIRKLAEEAREGLGQARDRLRTEFADFATRAHPEGVDRGNDVGYWIGDVAQRSSQAAKAGWSAGSASRQSGGDVADMTGAGFRAAADAFQAPRDEPTPSPAPGDAGANDTAGPGDATSDSSAVPTPGDLVSRRADLSLDRFRQELRAELRAAELEGRAHDGVLHLLDGELARVRDLVRHALTPRA